MDLENSTTEQTASTSQQQKPKTTRGVITPGQTVLFRLPRGDIKSVVLKQNSYEVLQKVLCVIELIVSGQSLSERLGLSTRMSSSETPLAWRTRSRARS